MDTTETIIFVILAVFGNPNFWLIMLSAIVTFFYNHNIESIADKWQNEVKSEKEKGRSVLSFDHLIYIVNHFAAFLVATILFGFSQFKYFIKHYNFKNSGATNLPKNIDNYVGFEALISILWVCIACWIVSLYFSDFHDLEKAYAENTNTALFSLPNHKATKCRFGWLFVMFITSLYSEYINYILEISKSMPTALTQ